jgi:hypothetical protein
VTTRTLLLTLALATTLSAQPAVRRATNIAALRAYPSFYHTRPILVVGTVGLNGNRLRVSDESGSIQLIFKDGSAPDGLDEVRGEFWDIGQMNPDDSRLALYDMPAIFGVDPEGTWPGRPSDRSC